MIDLSPNRQPNSIDRLILLIERADDTGIEKLGLYDNAVVGIPLSPQEIFSHFKNLDRYELKLNSVVAADINLEESYAKRLACGEIPIRQDDCSSGPLHVFQLKGHDACFQILNYPMKDLKWEISPYALYFDKNRDLQQQLMQVPGIICMHPYDPKGLAKIMIDLLNLAREKKVFVVFHSTGPNGPAFENPTFETFKWS